jgi:mono/diheme cytochrome c family protein
MLRPILVVLVLAPLAALGCSKPSSEGPSSSSATPAAPAATPQSTGDNAGESDPATAQADTIFKSRCSTCHGMEGKGNGPAAVTLNPKPRNYTDPVWQKSVTDDHIRETIIKGGAAVGKSPMMAPNPDLADKPAVVDALVKRIRAFAAK